MSYVIGLNLLKENIDNYLVKVETFVPKQGNIESYFNKPVLLNDKPVGVIVEAIEIDNKYKLNIVFWIKTIGLYSQFIGEDLFSIVIDAKEGE